MTETGGNRPTAPLPSLSLPEWGAPAGPVIAIDAEWAPDKRLLALGFASFSHAIAYTREEIDSRGACKADIEAVLLGARYLVGHSVPGDIDYLIDFGCLREEWVSGVQVLDSYILAKLVNENLGVAKVGGRGPYNLSRLLRRVYDVPDWKAESEAISKTDATAWPVDILLKRCAIDAWAAAILVKRLAPRVSRQVREYSHRLAQVLHRVYLTRVAVNKGAINSLGAGWRREATQHRELLARAARQHGLAEFSPTNDAHLRELVYDKMRLPVSLRTEKQGLPAVSKPALGQFKDNPVVQHIIAFNAADKMLTAWFGSENPDSKTVPLIQMIEAGPEPGVGYIRAVLNPFGARTGRRSSGGTQGRVGKNLQNWPPDARGVVVSRYPGGHIFSLDYARLEVVLFAWKAKDERLFDYFYKGAGYQGIATELFGATVEKGTPRYVMTKGVVLSVQYNAGDWQIGYQLWYNLGIRLARTFKAHILEAGKLRAQYVAMFPGIPRYIEARRQELSSTGRVEIVPGHYRHLPGYHSGDARTRGHLLNEAVNAPVQGLASYVTGCALLDTEAALLKAAGRTLPEHHRALLSGGVDYTVPINEVHDEIVYDVHPENAERDMAIIRSVAPSPPTLRSVVDLGFPLQIETKVGPTWAK